MTAKKEMSSWRQHSTVRRKSNTHASNNGAFCGSIADDGAVLLFSLLWLSSGEDTFGQQKLVNQGPRPLLSRPQTVSLSTYLAVPMTPTVGKPVLRLGMDVTDELSDYSMGGFFKSELKRQNSAAAKEKPLD